MNKKCKHENICVTSRIDYENKSYFNKGVFEHNELTDWDLGNDRLNIHVECLTCKSTWQGTDVDLDFPEWITEILYKELMVFGDNT